MEFKQLLFTVENEPVFETGLLLAGSVDSNNVRRQLSRWTRSGRVAQLRRGLYTLAPPYQKTTPHPFLIANRLVQGSYVSVQSALSYYGLIPDIVVSVTSVTTQRPGVWDTQLGRYEYRSIMPSLFYGFRWLDVGQGQGAFVATPEKALLDLVHLQSGGDNPAYLRELRLQNLDRLEPETLVALAEQSERAKLKRAAERILNLARAEEQEYETL